jgi:hypothetical protein
MSSALATITITLKNSPQTGEQNILFGSSQTGTTIDGSNLPVVFTSSTSPQETLLTGSSGQAQITNNSGGNLLGIDVTAPGYTFTDFIVDLNSADNSTIDITVVASDGTFTDSFTGKHGSNFITIVASDGETISSIDYTSSDTGWTTFKQPRISGLAVPEPSTWAMMFLGLAGLAFAGYRSSRGTAALH